MAGQPAAFMSYARFDDQHEHGQLSQFRERLSAEVQLQTGREFPIFQDRADISWGQNWQQRIAGALDEATLLLVILTPSFFRSPACRAEVQRFLERERELGRRDLILPVYYVSTPQLDHPAQFGTDELAQTLATRQYSDWRELRFEPLTSPVTRRAIAQLAERMRSPFWHSGVALPISADPPKVTETGRPGADSMAQVELDGLPGKTETPTLVVDQHLHGDFATVAEAISAAQPGDRILIRPGLYREGLVVDKPLEIIGDGPVADIEIHVGDAHALQFKAGMGRIANLTIRQTSNLGIWSAMEISQGHLELEGCDISSRGTACVVVQGGADPRLRRNIIHDGAGFGVVIQGQSLGILEDNEIFGHENSGVGIASGSNPTLRRNVIHDNKKYGVRIERQGRGVLEDNHISGSGYAGIQVTAGGAPMVRRNTITGNGEYGVYVFGESGGTLLDNEITGNGKSGVVTMNGGSPTVRGNRINRNRGPAVEVSHGGKGLFEDNDLTANQQGAWSISEGDKGHVTRARNRE